MISEVDQLMQSLFYLLIVFAILATPGAAIISEAAFLLVSVKRPETITRKKKSIFLVVDLITVFAAVALEMAYLDLCEVMFGADWQTQLYNSQKHQPIYTGSLPTFITIASIGIIGLCVLNLIRVNRTPPLIPVLAMSALYLGVLLSIVFTIHVIDFGRMGLFELYLLLPPIAFILMSLRVIFCIVREYDPSSDRMSKVEGSSTLSSLSGILNNSKRWPLIALIMMIPLLGIMICILMIFGQAPDAAIKAFTETADFRLSQKIPPQQLYYDEHYLCTVAAGGDRKVVKPLRSEYDPSFRGHLRGIRKENTIFPLRARLFHRPKSGKEHPLQQQSLRRGSMRADLPWASVRTHGGRKELAEVGGAGIPCRNAAADPAVRGPLRKKRFLSSPDDRIICLSVVDAEADRHGSPAGPVGPAVPHVRSGVMVFERQWPCAAIRRQ